jgi:transcriptional regulator GlxA family with amidase domain
MKPRTVGILIFDEVEVLDFCGPFEVFSVAGKQAGGAFDAFTVAEKHGQLSTRGGLSVSPKYAFDDVPKIDLLLIPGGQGSRPLLERPALLDWVRQRAAEAELVLSVCTGALLLAKAGLLDGLSATTHHAALDELRRHGPQTTVLVDERVVDNGRVITSAGVAAGIDMSFHVVARLLGQDTAARTAKYIEYPWPRH